MKKFSLIYLFVSFVFLVNIKAQTLYIPSGTGGIGTSITNNVGIGTSNPKDARLVLKGSDHQFIIFDRTDVSVCDKKGLIGLGYTAGVNTEHLYFSNTETYDHPFMVIKLDDGNVGIGTTKPTYGKLQIGSAGLNNGLTIYDDGVSGNWAFQMYVENNIGYLIRGISPTSGIAIDNTGNVGIGTEPVATHILSINGTMRCEGIDVIDDVPQADFVFNEDYNLMDMDELKVYLNENKHLPDVPSATEFLDGYNMQDMDELLLQKVEELHLYILQLKDENDKLKEELEIVKSNL